MTMVCLAFPLLLLVRRPWVPPLMQLGMFLGSLVWIQTLLVQASVRQARGVPVTRYVAIMAGVTLFTGVSALVFMLPSLRRRYGGKKGPRNMESAPNP
ncbi:MAG: hypothetical protein O7F11_08330 [Acidobacteria bacterium]|nr:hypothetical protein [Acidobacteriota bacterium]MCZ6833738.1 hypothetical protein [Acidobacteriota bacterium]